MRRFLRLACLLVLGLLVGETAFAQSGPRPTTGKAADAKAINERVDYWLKTCLADWDKATHMTNSEWRTTCKRVAEERKSFLLDSPYASSIGSRARPR